ncbi:MAG: sugar phosphate isomerase/epimerase [Kiritimatiellae bacterium]|nr:sugar phosphate isomerase/epimerase [Kiritimatiellia bacterium]
MKLRHSVMIGFMGRQADRFHEYQPAQDLATRLEMVKRVKGMEGMEIVYPSDFAEVKETVARVKDSGIAVSALNVNIKGQKKWQAGSLTAADPKLRAEAVADLKTGLDLAAELGTDMVTCCPLIDGHNYSFQADYTQQWGWLREGFAEAAKHRSDVRLSLEYKPNESRNFCLLRDMGRTLYLCEQMGLPHVGVTMDVGHALCAGETPAEAMCLAAQAGRLFYVHFNDNGREWDWDMLPGSVNLWDLLEMLFYLERLDWDGWLSYDVMTRDGDPVAQMEAAIEIVKTAEALLGKIGRDRLAGLVREGIPARAMATLMKGLV